ncbi:MAG: hypothetical protein AAFZ92_06790 [Pseudomonadota bacterium]
MTSNDPIWETIRKTTVEQAEQEPILASFLHATILNHTSLEDALSFHLANKLGSPAASALLIREMIEAALEESADVSEAMRADIVATYERDSACDYLSTPLLFYKGFHALQALSTIPGSKDGVNGGTTFRCSPRIGIRSWHLTPLR